jgi:hypothetical protein
VSLIIPVSAFVHFQSGGDKKMRNENELRNELESVASVQLRDILDNWEQLTDEQRSRLHFFIREEMLEYSTGLLTHDELLEKHDRLQTAAIMRQARATLKRKSNRGIFS